MSLSLVGKYTPKETMWLKNVLMNSKTRKQRSVVQGLKLNKLQCSINWNKLALLLKVEHQWQPNYKCVCSKLLGDEKMLSQHSANHMLP